ncbi:cytochrome P450 2U1-like isoform X2 [Dreissena polymorpha]|nr:cytochrome P450 2U1-like isoform X2 [Dreissena polymorpha]XP_052269845.1 cytochrome P450 2U1-like isoform X2 [Dreissena polymorpha]XP_052269846.1 cytochrome P450 2U1-like isoform X2 [Dreissena polymorpha]
MSRFAALRRKYGDVYGIYIGRELTVVLNGYDVIHDALVKHGKLFSVRPRSKFHQIMFKDPGIVFANGPMWKEHRQFAQRALNEFGYEWSERTIEERINEEIGYFLRTVGSHDGPYDVGGLVNLSVANVVAGIMFGKRCEYDDVKFKECLHSVGEAARLLTRSGLLMSLFPWLFHAPGDLLGIDKLAKIREKPRAFLNHVFYWHDLHFNREETRDVLGLYKQEIIRKLRKNDECKFNNVTMRALMGELLSAGSETTATCIIWTILYLVLNQELQEKLRSDIDRVVGCKRPPFLSDRKQLPLVEATILECLRISPVAPLSVPHAVHEDVSFRGHVIPAETTVLVNIHSVMKDPSTWSEPDVFKPERFLNNDGDLEIPNEFIAFSIGRRSCPGESLARMELFLYVTSLLQRFTLALPTSQPPPTTEGVLGMTFSPKPFQIIFTPRDCMSNPDWENVGI